MPIPPAAHDISCPLHQLPITTASTLIWVAEVLININKAAGSLFLTQEADDAGTWSSDYLCVITGNISQLKFLLSEHTADAKTCVSALN